MSAFGARIRSLARQAGSPRDERRAPERKIVATPLPIEQRRGESLQKQPRTGEQHRAALRRLLGLRERANALSAAPPSRGSPNGADALALDRRVEGKEIAPGLYFKEQRCCAENAVTASSALRFETHDLAVTDILLFDTETTGLAGGTGTRAFMIGAADFINNELRIRQLTLTTMSAESAMLAEFSHWLKAESHLVSYNGRCYDAPLLTTRYRLARLDNPLSKLAHLDLLHPVRRRYRGRWENCRMATIERQLLGIVREDDLPGSQAPMAWRSYLRGGSAVNLRRVAEHNAQDLKSLAALLLKLCQIEADSD